MSYRPKIKIDSTGMVEDMPLDAESVQGKVPGNSAGNIPVIQQDGKISADILPSYVDDVVEYSSLSNFPTAGETGKIYIALDTNYTYRWSGTTYVRVGGGDAPVVSVNGQTGAVTLTADNVGAPSLTDLSDLLDGETTRATEQENKSLYHLGAFDSVNGNVITRQTGYVDLSKLNWQYQSTVGCWYAENVLPNATECVASNYTCYNNKDYSQLANGELTTNNSSWGAIPTIIIKDSQSNYPTGILQYKLATSYTEDIIENQSILPLDSNMANKIRQKVVDGLNLFNNTLLPKLDYTTTGNTYADFRIEIWAKPDTSGSQIAFFNSYNTFTRTIASGNYYFRVGLNGNARDDKYFIPTPIHLESGTYTMGFDLTLEEPNHYIVKSLMLTKSDHPYPYSPFNQKEHITNEQAELLKQEEEKCRNLFNNTTDYTYTGYGVDVNVNGNQCVLNGTSNDGYFQTIATYTLQAGIYSYKQYILSGSSVDLTKCRFGLKDANNNYIPLGLESGSFTLNQTTTFNIVFWWGVSGIAFNNTKLVFMLNTGDTPEPYHDWCGDIVHMKDVEPVLLWENGSPNSAFASQTITTKDMSKFKYIIFKVKRLEDCNSYKYYKIPYAVNNQVDSAFIVSARYIYSREYIIASATSITVADGYYGDISNGSSISIDRCSILVEIYGTNIL